MALVNLVEHYIPDMTYGNTKLSFSDFEEIQDSIVMIDKKRMLVKIFMTRKDVYPNKQILCTYEMKRNFYGEWKARSHTYKELN